MHPVRFVVRFPDVSFGAVKQVAADFAPSCKSQKRQIEIDKEKRRTLCTWKNGHGYHLQWIPY
jgi:hypothetical protein